jgi:hypothetical protein
LLLYDPAQPESPTQYARRFDNILYGDAPTTITEATTRFVLNNPNGVTRDGLYEHLTEYLMELLEIGVDVIQLPESNVDWRHPNKFKKCRQAVLSQSFSMPKSVLHPAPNDRSQPNNPAVQWQLEWTISREESMRLYEIPIWQMELF